MDGDLLRGAAAGAIGTAALNATTYLDVAVRGRPPSSVPAQAAERTADALGVDLAAEGPDSPVAEHRRTALGALMGYITGVGVGVAYGLVRPRLQGVPLAVAGLAAGGAAMAASDTGMALSGTSDPRSWDTAGWLADIVPHVVYGLAVAAAFDALTRRRR